jgi:uncharacterized protein (TIGR02145 family)
MIMSSYGRLPLWYVLLCASIFFLYSCETLEEGFEFQPIPAISGLDCDRYQLSAPLTEGQAAQGVTVKVPYQSSNGLFYPGEVVSSAGVTGLTARLQALTFQTSPDSLTYIISGTPASAGTAKFSLGAGRDSCDLNLVVGSRAGAVNTLDCAFSQLTGIVAAGIAVNGVSLRVPYTGGNGGVYDTQVIQSSVLTGLVATLPAGQLAQGNGELVFQLSGNLATTGSAVLLINVGGKSCNAIIPVNLPDGCGAFIAPGVWKTFMCYNLGAFSTSVDPFTPSWQIIGNYYQWGRNIPAAAGPSSSIVTNDGAPGVWNTIVAPDNSWQDSIKTINDPCPPGFRVPTSAQWLMVADSRLNPQSIVGTNWTCSATNYSTGWRFGPKLFLPTSGGRDFNSGILNGRGCIAWYWSSTKYALDGAFSSRISFNQSTQNPIDFGFGIGTLGYTVRCIAE